MCPVTGCVGVALERGGSTRARVTHDRTFADNLRVHPAAGLLFPDWVSGATLRLTGPRSAAGPACSRFNQNPVAQRKAVPPDGRRWTLRR
jgi:hypothetical protein